MDRRVAIVGGGISGLMAGYTLQKACIGFEIFEKSAFPGGRMSSETVDGCIIDKGAYTVPEFYHGLNRLLKEIGLRSQLVKTPSTSATFLNGNAYNIKIGSPGDFLRYRLISAKSKWHLIKIGFTAKLLGKALDTSRPTEKSFDLERETAADYILDKYGDEFLERIVDPIFCELYLGRPENNSKLALLAALANLTMFGINVFQSGMGYLPQYLARQFDVHFKTPVYRIRKQPIGSGYDVFAGNDANSYGSYDAIILALPLPDAADMLEDVSEEIRTAIRSIEYAPSIVTVWGTEKSNEWPAMINNFSRNETDVIATVISDDQKASSRVPPEKNLTTVILKEAASHEMLDSPDEMIREKTISEILRFSPSFDRQIDFCKIYRWPHAAIQFPPGALSKRKVLRERLEKDLDRIYVASDSFHRTSIEVSLKTGMTAARRVINALS